MATNLSFKEHYIAQKTHILQQYSSLSTKCSNTSKDSIKNYTNKFSFDLRFQVSRTLQHIIKWFQTNSQKLFDINGEKLKKKLKHIACPVTVKDHMIVFEEIEGFLGFS